MRLIDADALKEEFPKDTDWEYPVNTNHFVCETIDSQPTIDAVSVIRKAAKKLAYIHQQIDLYGDRPDLHDEEYWLEYLMDEEWKDDEID